MLEFFSFFAFVLITSIKAGDLTKNDRPMAPAPIHFSGYNGILGQAPYLTPNIHTKQDVSTFTNSRKIPRKFLAKTQKGFKVGHRVKLRLAEKLKHDDDDASSPVRGLLFVVYMLITLFVSRVPQNVMIRHNHQFWPVDPQFYHCQRTFAGDFKCQLKMPEGIAINNDHPNVQLWANVDGDRDTLELLGTKDVSQCLKKNDNDFNGHCRAEFSVNASEIPELPKIYLSDNQHPSARKLLADATVSITLVNGCNEAIWPGFSGDITAPKLEKGQSVVVNVPGNWESGRIWGNTACDGGGASYCNAHAAQPPVSLAEFTLGKPGGDFYDVSYVDGSNVPLSIRPQPGTHADEPTCAPVLFDAGKTTDLPRVLPDGMKVRSADGTVIGLKSVCLADGTDAVCCKGAYNTPDACKPDAQHGWTQPEIDAYNALQAAFPTSYNYAYDDKRATFTCHGTGERQSADYQVGFCTN